jgi:hypothetical protein
VFCCFVFRSEENVRFSSYVEEGTNEMIARAFEEINLSSVETCICHVAYQGFNHQKNPETVKQRLKKIRRMFYTGIGHQLWMYAFLFK